jgi:hypothetical protein
MISAIQIDIMRYQFFVRGAISAGAYYENNGVVFGPAFTRAVKLEKSSVWPRVIVDTSVLKNISQSDIAKAFESFLVRDESGLSYLNYLHLVFVLYYFEIQDQIKQDRSKSIDYCKKFKQHRDYIVREAESIIKEKRIELLPKYHSVAHYHNRYVTTLLESLPTSENYSDATPGSLLSELVNIYKTFFSSRAAVDQVEIDSFLQMFTKALYDERSSLENCLIDIEAIFRPLYPPGVEISDSD